MKYTVLLILSCALLVAGCNLQSKDVDTSNNAAERLSNCYLKKSNAKNLGKNLGGDK
jgi:hypothetical protein